MAPLGAVKDPLIAGAYGCRHDDASLAAGNRYLPNASASGGFGPFSIKSGDSMDFSLAPVFGLRL